jgi:16S rRNA (uracil1498-N3)-methyltransferase
MLRVLHPVIPREGGIILSEEESHHLVRVRRAGVGERVEVLDGNGMRALAIVREARPKAARLVLEGCEELPAPPVRLSLLCAIPKGKTMEGIVQKATELGVGEIRPLLTDHGEVQLDRRRADHKVTKWEAIADEALKQCGNPWRPSIAPPSPLGAALASLAAGTVGLVASLQPPVVPIEAAFAGRPPPPRVALAVGPEGDFSAREYEAFAAAGWHGVTLGPLVLRSETACCALLAVVLHELRRCLES